VQEFYGNIGRRLTTWTPKAPTPAEKTPAVQIEEISVIDPDRLSTVEKSLAMVLSSLSTGSQPVEPPAPTGSDPNPATSLDKTIDSADAKPDGEPNAS
jgi:hypothetical protein